MLVVIGTPLPAVQIPRHHHLSLFTHRYAPMDSDANPASFRQRRGSSSFAILRSALIFSHPSPAAFISASSAFSFTSTSPRVLTALSIATAILE